jgi:4-hydroxyphenylacetate 3-monooxygenase
MGIRTGEAYLAGLRDDREIWIHGKRVEDVTTHPGMGRGPRTLARFLDKQFDPALSDILTYEEDGERIAMSFLPPKSPDDVRRRGAAYYEWARWSNGMLGRTPDYKNASIMAFGTAAEFLGQGRTDYASNMRDYYKDVRTGDKVLTHTLVNPQISLELAREGKFSGDVALKIIKETDAGVIVSGARLLATLGPFADEIEVFPSTLLKASDENEPFAIAFAVPVSTPGLRMICRDSYDHGKTPFDAPLSSRYEELDAVVIFDNVLVPWERIFMYRDPSLCNQAFTESNAVLHMMHQVTAGKLAKAEFVVGLLCAMAHATNKDKGMAVKGQIAEAMWIAESIRAFLFSAEHQAKVDKWGNYVPLRRPLDTSRNLFPKMYPRLVELVQLLGSSSLMATPSDADFSNGLAPDVERYFQVANLNSRDRVGLFRLAHDFAVSGFGGRQALYERFFFGPPAILAAVYFDLYDKDDMIGRVEDLLAQTD